MESPTEAVIAIRESAPSSYQSAHVSQSPQMKTTEVKVDEDANCKRYYLVIFTIVYLTCTSIVDLLIFGQFQICVI